MNRSQNTNTEFINNAKEAALHIGLLIILITISFIIFKPFLVPIAWGIILAVALFPVCKKLTVILKGRKRLAAILIVLVFLVLLIIPTIKVSSVSIDGIQSLSKNLEEGTLNLPPVPEGVKDWPVIGDRVWEIWNQAEKHISDGLKTVSPQLKQIGEKLADSISGLVAGFFIFVFSIIMAGVFMVHSESGYSLAVKVFVRLQGNKGVKMVDNSILVIRSVVNGVLGVALIQTVLVGIGFILADIPGALVLILLTLLLAIMQIPTLLIIIPVVIYAFPTMSTTGAIVFTVWSLVTGASDNFLKPIFLGRGIDIPMPVVLIGAIGGMIAGGIIGMFIGAVILSVTYQLFLDWMDRDGPIQVPDLESKTD